MRASHAVLLLILLTGIFACGRKDEARVQVSGEFKNIAALKDMYPGMFDGDSIRVWLYEIPFGTESQPLKLDSAVVTPDNPQFELEALAPKVGLYDVLVENGPMIPVINDRPVTLEIDLTNRERYYDVKGSSGTGKLREFIFGYSERSMTTGMAFRRLDSLKMAGGDDQQIIDATDQKNNSLSELNTYVRGFLKNAESPLISSFVLGLASRSFSEEEYSAALEEAIAKYPSDANLQFLKAQLVEAQTEASQGPESWVGRPAPEMSMPDPDGKEISLADFKGRYVLVDFWASWCGPCRQENPNLVRTYHQFKNKNFTILGVSLDRDRESWLKAIEDDQLAWTHISDLAFWNSKSVEIFGFQGIPFNVLIDPSGTIVAEGLRGEALPAKLAELLN